MTGALSGIMDRWGSAFAAAILVPRPHDTANAAAAFNLRSDIGMIYRADRTDAEALTRQGDGRRIEGGPSGLYIVPPADRTTATGKRTPAIIRFDIALLAREDWAAKRRGVSRSARVAFTFTMRWMRSNRRDRRREPQ